MKKFQEMCQEEFEKIELMARGGQKIVFDGVHNSYGETVIKLYFQLNDPRSLREIQIERDLNLSMVPKIYETGTIEQHHKLKEKMERNLFAGSFHCVKI